MVCLCCCLCRVGLLLILGDSPRLIAVGQEFEAAMTTLLMTRNSAIAEAGVYCGSGTEFESEESIWIVDEEGARRGATRKKKRTNLFARTN